MNKKKVIIIGCGLVGHIYAKVLVKLHYEILAIVDKDQSRLDKVHKICSSKTLSFRSYDEILKKIPANTYDIVAIALPAHYHLEIIIKFSKINKNILCEKPFTENYKEAKLAIKHCQKYKVKLAVGFKMRYEKIFLELKKIIDKGIIGDLKVISISYFQKIPNQPWAKINGIHREMFVHPLDLVMWIVGKNLKLEYVDKKIKSNLEQRIYAKLKYKNIECFINNGWLRNYANLNGKSDFVLNAIGSKGQIILIRPNFLKVFLSNKVFSIKFPKFDYDKPFYDEWKNFISYLNTSKVGELVLNRDCLNFHKIIDKIESYE